MHSLFFSLTIRRLTISAVLFVNMSGLLGPLLALNLSTRVAAPVTRVYSTNAFALLRTVVCVSVLLSTLLSGARAHGDELVYGSFKDQRNAQNWAARLNSLLEEPVQVVEAYRQDQLWYRVQTVDLDAQQMIAAMALARRQDLQFWRLRDGRQLPMDAPFDEVDTPESTVGPEQSDPRPAAPRSTAPRSGEPDPAPSPLPDHPVTSAPGGGDTKAFPAPDRAQDPAAPGWFALHNWHADLGVQAQIFEDTGDFDQDAVMASVSFEPEYYNSWHDGRDSFTFTPFLRLDGSDSERTHFDVRELFYSRVGDSWDVHVGARRVFWGVTEFHHLVDIVNQTDLVENIDAEDKLGQPMIQLSVQRDWGLVDVFALTGFRERTFAGEDGRLRLPFRILDDARYESGAEELRTDFAIRWSHYFGPIEAGVHHFSGTSRDPIWDVRTTGMGAVALSPYYPVIDQTGLDAQWLQGDWAFKLEAMSRSGFGRRYAAANLGFERTLVGFLGSRADLGVVVEYMWDERGEAALNTAFERDLALGGRLQLNDFANTQALFGVIVDTVSHEYLISLEASRQLNDNWSLYIEGRLFNGGEHLPFDTLSRVLTDSDYKSSWVQNDDYLQLELKRFF